VNQLAVLAGSVINGALLLADALLALVQMGNAVLSLTTGRRWRRHGLDHWAETKRLRNYRRRFWADPSLARSFAILGSPGVRADQVSPSPSTLSPTALCPAGMLCGGKLSFLGDKHLFFSFHRAVGRITPAVDVMTPAGGIFLAVFPGAM